MEENFVGYVLNALDGDTSREVEEYLRSHPEARRQVDLLRQALRPLAADADPAEPPPGLAVRTLGRVAEYCCRDVAQPPVLGPRHRAEAASTPAAGYEALPRSPTLPLRRAPAGPSRWWRRADVLVAASLFLCASLLTLSVVSHAQRQYQLEACKNNLRQFGEALFVYKDKRHTFPNVADHRLLHQALQAVGEDKKPIFPNGADQPTPRDVAGMVVPILIAEGCLPEDITVRCPGNGPPIRCPKKLDELANMPADQFQRLAPRLSCCYAYSLGYRNGRNVEPVAPDSPVPIMADRPPFREGPPGPDGNSPNHGGAGQNVLFTDGHVGYLTGNTLNGKSFYLNREGRVAAGVDRNDAVVGLSESGPWAQP
jgi:prepilin-type processing-associated H-X9-DG protein